MATRNTGTAVTEADGSNRTATHLSTHILIKVNGNIVGAVTALNINESREIAMVKEIGTDGVIDSAPSGAATVSGSCDRTRFDRQRIAPAFGRGFIHVKAQRVPFDIEIHDTFIDVENPIVTTIKNVWIKSLETSYSANDWIIVDKMGWVAEDIYSIVGNNNNVAGVVGPQGQSLYLNKYEREADRGDFRGAIDAPGLLTAFLTDPAS